MSNARIQGSKSMSLVGYSRILFKVFSKITFDTTSLQNMAMKFERKQRCEERFQLFRKILTNAPMLRIENLKKYLIMCIDVCKDGIGVSSPRMGIWSVMNLENLETIQKTFKQG